jgi:hypothetical protein
MPQHPTEETSARALQRLTKFLDCVAYLLARRWLREQQQELPEETPAKGNEAEP